MEFVPDDHVTLAPFADYYGGAPANTGLVFKVVPDETMRGLELRNGSVDLVVNDLSPDMIHGLAQGSAAASRRPGPAPTTRTSASTCATRMLQDGASGRRSATPSIARAIVAYLRRGSGPAGDRHRAADVLGVRPDDAPSSRTISPRRARCSTKPAVRDPDGDGPRPRLRLTLKTSTAEPYRLQAAVIQQKLAEAGIALEVRS